MEATTQRLLASVLAERPAVLDALGEAHRRAWEITDAARLQLCRYRVAMLLGATGVLDGPDRDVAGTDGAGDGDGVGAGRGTGEAGDAEDRLDAQVANLAMWPTSPLFDDTDRACLAFTEEFVIDVASLSDSTAQAVLERLGEQGFVDFANALLIIEQRLRMRLAWERLEVA